MTDVEFRMPDETRDLHEQDRAAEPQRRGDRLPSPAGMRPLGPVSPCSAVREEGERHRRRPAWRQRLVQAERGLVRGIRGDSAFFVHFFGISVVIAAALVLGIGGMQWVAIAGCLTLVLTAEMFNQALKALAHSSGQDSTPGGQRALAIGTAAVLVACIGSSVVLTLVFWERFQQLFA